MGKVSVQLVVQRVLSHSDQARCKAVVRVRPMTGAAIIRDIERCAGSRIATDLIRHTLAGDATLAFRPDDSYAGIDRNALTFDTGFIGDTLHACTWVDHHAFAIDACFVCGALHSFTRINRHAFAHQRAWSAIDAHFIHIAGHIGAKVIHDA